MLSDRYIEIGQSSEDGIDSYVQYDINRKRFVIYSEISSFKLFR